MESILVGFILGLALGSALGISIMAFRADLKEGV